MYGLRNRLTGALSAARGLAALPLRVGCSPSIATVTLRRSLSTGSTPRVAIVMLNMGGPPNQSEVEPFLRRLFTDPDIIPLGRFQQQIGSFVARPRAPKVAAQ
jgi:protoporphyrin/coproporphyrin ferrochelatase